LIPDRGYTKPLITPSRGVLTQIEVSPIEVSPIEAKWKKND